MTTTTTIVAGVPDQVILLDVSWETYETLSAALGDSNAVRLSYDGATLEILAPGPLHETLAVRLSDLLTLVMGEWDINIVGTRSTTFKNEESVKGFEADHSYYIANSVNVRDIRSVDITIDPPPDLAIEIDISNPEVAKLDKFNLYARVRVPEFWRYSEHNGLEAFALVNNAYEAIATSRVISGLPIKEIAARLHTTPADSRGVVREWRTWLRAHLAPRT